MSETKEKELVLPDEIWGPIIDYEDYYEISNLGRIKSLDRTVVYTNRNRTQHYKSKLLTPSKNQDGYFKVSLNKDGKLDVKIIHRLVALAFIPNPENKPQINHIDGNKLNNCVDNLEWNTNIENLNHSYLNNLNPNIKLSKDDVILIRNLHSLKIHTQAEIGKMFNVNKEHINSIVNNKKRTKL